MVFALFIYQTVLAKTIQLYAQNKELNLKLKEASGAPAQLALLYKKLSALDNVLQSPNSDSAQNTHDVLLSSLSRYCKENNTTLKRFSEPTFNNQGEFEIQTNSFTAQGSFSNLLRLIYLLEQKQRVGKISSVSFETSKDINTQKTLLTANVYLQTIKTQK